MLAGQGDDLVATAASQRRLSLLQPLGIEPVLGSTTRAADHQVLGFGWRRCGGIFCCGSRTQNFSASTAPKNPGLIGEPAFIYPVLNSAFGTAYDH